MVLKLERFNLEHLATKNTIKILRFLILKPYLSFGLSELSKELNISKSNVLRILKVLTQYNLILEQKSSRKKVYRINYEINTVKIMWKLFMDEERQNINVNFKNVIDLLYHQVRNDVELFIVFGSVAQGLATQKSDIDICIVSKKSLDINKFEFLPHRFEIHEYEWDDIKNPVDFVVLEALLNGIVFKGDILKIIAEIRSFGKPYVIYRIEKAKEFLNKSKSLEGETRTYYEKIAEITIGEIKSIIRKGKTKPKRKISLENIEDEIKWLENEISREGDKIWLI